MWQLFDKTEAAFLHVRKIEALHLPTILYGG